MRTCLATGFKFVVKYLMAWHVIRKMYDIAIKTSSAVVFYLACAWKLEEDDSGFQEPACAVNNCSQLNGQRRRCSRE